jgi:hypothetical protein
MDVGALASLPARARLIIGGGLSAVAERAMLGTAAKRKQLGTDDSRRAHYVYFATQVLELDDAQLMDLAPKVQTYVLITYCNFLCQGNTLKGIICREPTIKGYMQVASQFVASRVGRDVRCFEEPDKPHWQWKEHPFFDTRLKEVRRWQGIKNRQEAVTKTMVNLLRQWVQEQDNNSHDKALLDWLIVGLYTGFRAIEWLQEKACSKEADFRIAEEVSGRRDNLIYALTGMDVRFVNKANQPIAAPLETTVLDIAATKIRWRFQKNGEHGEEVTFASCHEDPDFCVTRAMLRIMRRHKALGVPAHWPLAIYKRNRNSRRPNWFTVGGVDRKLKNLGQAAYGSSEPDAPKMKFTCHSIRIGACTLMHAAGRDPLDIKSRLRWKSDSFMMYLRDVPRLALNHTKAVTETDVDSFSSWVMG